MNKFNFYGINDHNNLQNHVNDEGKKKSDESMVSLDRKIENCFKQNAMSQLEEVHHRQSSDFKCPNESGFVAASADSSFKAKSSQKNNRHELQ